MKKHNRKEEKRTGNASWTCWFHRLVVWATSSKVHILAIDHYPGTWGPPLEDWSPLDVLLSICNQYNKKAAIMETGFSTPGWWWHDEDYQINFINDALPKIRSKALTQNIQRPNKFPIATWYELRDSNTQGFTLNPVEAIEWNFGILHTGYSMKKGYSDLQIQISTFT
ncbi:MAG: hypothetical protein QXU48_00360 [Thermoplasmata archaeon]